MLVVYNHKLPSFYVIPQPRPLSQELSFSVDRCKTYLLMHLNFANLHKLSLDILLDFCLKLPNYVLILC